MKTESQESQRLDRSGILGEGADTTISKDSQGF